jgi:hypothetical protein
MQASEEEIELYHQMIQANEHHLKALEQIVRQYQPWMEGNCFYDHGTLYRNPTLISKQINIWKIARNPQCKQIFEIGFNAGHSCLLMLLSQNQSQITIIDICFHPYVRECFNYLNQQFPNRLVQLAQGDSIVLLPKILTSAATSYDLYHIDGGHLEQVTNRDFLHCYAHGKRNHALILFDDVQMESQSVLWNLYVQCQLVEPIPLLATTHYKHVLGKAL